MSTGPKQFGWWRRRELEAATQKGKGRRLPAERLRALMAAAVFGGIAWTGFYWTYGSHRIASLAEFANYLRGEDLYRKYEVTNLKWDCEALRRQFDAQYLSTADSRIDREDKTLIFYKSGLNGAEFEKWTSTAEERLRFGHARQVDNDAMLVPAMMVRLFSDFRFESGNFARDVKNTFNSKCGG